MWSCPASVLLWLTVALSQEEAARPTLLRHVHVVDVESGALLRDRDLWLEGGRIARIEPAGGKAAPAGASVVEGSGRYLLPGLFDMHVHLNEEDDVELLTLFLANGVTAVQSMHGSPYTLSLRERVAKGEVLGPRIFSTGPTTAQLGVHEPEHAERVAREQKAAGFDAIKMYGDGRNTMPRETYHRLITTAHGLGMQVVGHAPRNLPFSVVLEEHQDSIDHMEEIVYTDAGLRTVVGPYVDLQFGGGFAQHSELLGPVPDFAAELADEIRALAGQVKAAGLHVTPTLVTFGTIQRTTNDDFFELQKLPDLVYAHPVRRALWCEGRFRTGGWQEHLAFMADYLERNHELQLALARAFHEAGVPLMTGTDAPFDFTLQGFSLHGELAQFVRAGLTPLDALRAATIVPARFRGVAQDAGSVAAGKRADLVLVEGNPLDDVANARRVVGVFLGGRWLSPEFLRERMAAIAERHAGLAKVVEGLRSEFEGARYDEALALFARATPKDAGLERYVERKVNDGAYALLRGRKLAEAVALFRRNTELFPRSSNAWDSLGEGLMEQGADEESIDAYGRSLELNPGNENARTRIERLVQRAK